MRNLDILGMGLAGPTMKCYLMIPVSQTYGLKELEVNLKAAVTS